MVIFYLSAFALLALFFTAGAIIGKGGEKNDYSLGGRKAGAAGVTGILLGALVGGASTVGTAQMAYSYGMTALWFTLGGGIGCLLLGLRFAVPLRRSRVTTIADYLSASYGGGRCGSAIAFTATVASSLGTFISVCAQFLSCIALLCGVLPISTPVAALLSALSIWGFIAFGGMKSFARLGEAKIAILYVVLIVCAASALGNGGFSAIRENLSFHPWLNSFGRGFIPEAGYLASMIVGVFTTQIYIQSFAAAKDLHSARRGAYASALLMPPMGLLGAAIGLSVRARGIEIEPGRVLPWFIMDSFPPALGGLLWGGVVITVVGAAAGLTLGVATNISKNIIPRERLASYLKRSNGTCASAALAKAFAQLNEKSLVVIMISIAALIGTATTGSMILEWSFMSMGLRGAGSFVPFVLAVIRPGLLPPRWALASCCCGLAAMLAWAASPMPGDPLFAGLALSVTIGALGILCGKRHISITR